MLVLLLLLGYTIAVVWLGPRLTTSRPWASAAPRLGLLLCQAVPAAAVSGILLMAAMTAVSVQHLRVDVGHLLHACVVAVWNGATHSGVPVTTALGLIAVALLTHLVRTAALSTAASRQVRRRQHAGLGLLGEGCKQQGYIRVLSEQMFAYCLPGGGGRIVISTATERELDHEQLGAVLAHERAHLRGRHHALVQITHVLSHALPLPSVRALHQEVSRLVELAADDEACRHFDRDALLTALLVLAVQRTSTPGLAANGPTTVARALRLAEPLPQRRRGCRTGVCTAAAGIVLTPWLIGGIPFVLALTGHCDA